VWRSLSLRGAGARAKAVFRGVLRAGAVFAALSAAAVTVAATPDLWPRLLYFSAAMTCPRDALAVIEDRWTEPDPTPQDSGEALPDTSCAPESSAAPAPDRDDPPDETAETTAEPVPEVPEDRRGVVLTEQYSYTAGGLYVPFGAALIRNGTEIPNETVERELSAPLDLGSGGGSGGPQVLIYHTHATEKYEPADRGYFDLDYVWRTADTRFNMAAVGEAVAQALSARGVSVLHDVTLHDSPSYTGSYARSAETIKSYLERYPTIKVLLDLHRDAIEPEEGVIVKPTAVIDGRNAAQIMVLCGCDDGTMDMPDYFSNLRFAAALTSRLESLHPGLTRPVMFSYHRYNMDLSPGLLLIEIGASGNTLPEAEYSGELLAGALADILAG